MPSLSERNPWVMPLALFLLALSLQMGLSISLPVMADEAYYWGWSRSLKPGYFDHPPGIAFWIALFGGHFRIAGLFSALGEGALLALTARNLCVQGWRYAPALFLWAPIALGQNVIATPDQPLALCFCGAICFWSMRPSFRSNLGLIVCLSLGLWCKLTLLWALPGLLMLLGLRRSIAVLFGVAILYMPHIVWSSCNEWLPWSFQSGRKVIWGLDGIASMAVFLLAQIFLWGPWAFGILCRARQNCKDEVTRRLLWLILPNLAIFSLCSLLWKTEANWALLCWPPLSMLCLHLIGQRPRWFKAAMTYSVAMSLIAVLGLRLLPPEKGPPREGFEACLQKEIALPIVSTRYQEKALLDLYGLHTIYHRAVGHRRSEYDRQEQEEVPRSYAAIAVPGKGDQGIECHGKRSVRMVCGREIHFCLE